MPIAGLLRESELTPEAARRQVTKFHRQTTLGRAVEVAGVGLHTGNQVAVRLTPAPAFTGFVFRRTDLGDFDVPAAPHAVARVSYATTLMRQGVMVSTVEHLLAALVGSGVDNCIIEIDGMEVPILDGSAEGWVDLIESAGVRELEAARQFLRIRRPVDVVESHRSIRIVPADEYRISCHIDFDHPVVGSQRRSISITNGEFGPELAAARTFGFAHEVEALRQAGLIQGGSTENAIVLTPHGGMLNEVPLRWPDEFVRHKMIDIVGDLALFGMPILGHVIADRAGHALHTQLVAKVVRDESAWEIVSQPVTEAAALLS
ncbi:MAG: UDP-3-O-acyl-N-acetylglucosamine deacetylase [Blastocatellia bacterium]|nr:UDP-3-O-acyl-N-acetylglucosamine deacetylase [Blastocatellia bacterium]MBK6428315.1 UDP-3-O-acyl-N-acetylglucosamine deacetylase [Blastocatellia bacterium]